jgi:phospholipase A1
MESSKFEIVQKAFKGVIKMKYFLGILIALTLTQWLYANEPVKVSDYQRCLLDRIDQASSDVSIGDLRIDCLREANISSESSVVAALPAKETSVIDERFARERDGIFNPFALTPHKPTYIGASLMSEANQAPYATAEHPEPADDHEMVFQISFKAPLWRNAMGSSGDLWMAYTAKSWWQLFNDEFSSPFRETNYEPEVFWQDSGNFSLFGWDLDAYRLGFVHQSNGQNVPRSRSWNRVYAHFGFSKGAWTLSLKPWYRIPEDDKKTPDATDGDDNPDIWRYMGYGEYGLSYRTSKSHLWSLMTRYNFHSDAKGAAALSWSFPLSDRFRGYAEIFSGYGDSMIDYNASITRFTLGIALTDNL